MENASIHFDPETAAPLIEQVMQRSGQNVTACYQCRRCASGCPVGEETGHLTPDRLIRLILLGDMETALSNDLVWRCVSCCTCGTRCPNQIQTARITETLKQLSKEARVETSRPRIAHFHDAFVQASVRRGRVAELEFMALYEFNYASGAIKAADLKSRIAELFTQGRIGMAMLRLRRLRLGLHRIKGRTEVKRLVRRSTRKRFSIRAQSRGVPSCK